MLFFGRLRLPPASRWPFELLLLGFLAPGGGGGHEEVVDDLLEFVSRHCFLQGEQLLAGGGLEGGFLRVLAVGGCPGRFV